MANTLSHALTQSQACTADSIYETQALYVNREEFEGASDEMSKANSEAMGDWRGGGFPNKEPVPFSNPFRTLTMRRETLPAFLIAGMTPQ
jgi:hypothetical protein